MPNNRSRTRPVRTECELHSDSKTLCYELRLFFGIGNSYPLEAGDNCAGTLINNALLESFAIHTRALIMFFYGHSNESSIEGTPFGFTTRDTDVLAIDFLPEWNTIGPSPTLALATAKNNADKQIAHITVERRELNQPGNSGWTSVWNLTEITRTLTATLRSFMENCPESNMETACYREMQEIVAHLPVVPRNANLPHNNVLMTGSTSVEVPLNLRTYRNT